LLQANLFLPHIVDIMQDLTVASFPALAIFAVFWLRRIPKSDHIQALCRMAPPLLHYASLTVALSPEDFLDTIIIHGFKRQNEEIERNGVVVSDC